MVDYHNHYLKKDILLLADVFEKFIDTCLKFYGLDPCHYFSSPGLSWDAMLKMTGVKLEKISDIDKCLVIDIGLNIIISYITKRYANANNKYMKDCDPEKPSKFIIYLDMNNIYGWPIIKYLHYERFEWLKNFDGFDVMSIGKKSKIEFILEVDREKLHTSPYCSTRHASKFTCAIYRTREIIVFSLLVLLLLYISRKKFFIKGFFIEDYVNEI